MTQQEQQSGGESSSPSSKAATAAMTTTTRPTLPLVGSKMRKKMAAQLHEHVSAPTSKFAVQQLEKMGWTAGTGLGKKRDGIVSHIKVQKRAEQAGLGTEQLALQAARTAESWWKDSLGDTLAKLASSKGGKKKRKKEYTDEELFQATGGARFGTKGGKLRQAKWRRTETGSSDENKTEIILSDDGNDHDAVRDADKLFKEEALNAEMGDNVSADVEKKKRSKDKKKKKLRKEGKKEKKEKKKKSKRVKEQE